MARLRGRFRRAFGLGLASLGAASAAQVLNFYREPLFGFIPGNAAHNFGFNLTYYLPLILLSAGLALASAIIHLRSVRTLLRSGLRPSLREWLTLLPASPALLITLLTGVFVISVVLNS